MDKNFLKYIWAHTKYAQIWMLVIILISMPVYFYSLEIPKRIVNGPIDGSGFPGGNGTDVFLNIDLPFGEQLTGERISLFGGFELTRLQLLAALSAVFLLLVMLNQWIKLYLNTLKGKTAERVIRRLRYDLFDRVLRFPVWRARQVKASEVSGIIKDEVDLLTDFVGESYSTPLFQSGQALTGLTFLFLQNIWFGLLTLAIVSFQFLVIPLLRRRLIELGKLRQITARAMAGRVGEVIQGIDDVHVNDTSNYARAALTGQLGEIFSIRLELFRRKYSVKSLNNLLMQLLAMLFYLVGGYFVIVGRLDLGALVASIAAYKDLPGPIRALIDWDQQRQMAQIRFVQAIEGFLRDDLSPPALQTEDSSARIQTGFSAKNLGFHEEGTSALLEAVSVQIGVHETVAVIADPPEASVRFLEIFARLREPTAGRVLVDDAELKSLPEAVTGRRIGYADSRTFLSGGTIHGLLLEVLKNRPVRPATDRMSTERVSEATRVGNSLHDYHADWVDYERLSISNERALLDHIRSVTLWAGLHDEICELGVNSRITPQAVAPLATKIVVARNRLRDSLASHGLEGYVEPFDIARYNMRSSIAENILFGMPVDPAFAPQALARNETVRDLLDKSGLKDRLLALGTEIARTFVEMLGSDASEGMLFESVTGLTQNQVSGLREIITRVDMSGAEALDRQDENELIALAMNYVEPRDRFGLIDESLMQNVLEARRLLHERLESSDGAPVIFHDFETYNPSLTIMENILFGRIDTNLVGGRARVTKAVSDVLGELDLWDDVFEAGLAYDVGTAGRNLSDGQQQKLRVARALIKKPDILILNRACAALPLREQRAILESVLTNSRNVAGERPGIICAPADPEHSTLFERVLFLEQGRLVTDGPSLRSSGDEPGVDALSRADAEEPIGASRKIAEGGTR